MSENERIVAIEEHFISPTMAKEYTGHHKLSPFMHSTRRLEDLGIARIREMDEAGIDVQVISHLQPGPQVFPPDMSVALAREANNILHEGILLRPAVVARPRTGRARFGPMLRGQIQLR